MRAGTPATTGRPVGGATLPRRAPAGGGALNAGVIVGVPTVPGAAGRKAQPRVPTAVPSGAALPAAVLGR